MRCRQANRDSFFRFSLTFVYILQTSLKDSQNRLRIVYGNAMPKVIQQMELKQA